MKGEYISRIEQDEVISINWLSSVWSVHAANDVYLMLLGYYLFTPQTRFALSYAAMQEIDFLISICRVKMEQE